MKKYTEKQIKYWKSLKGKIPVGIDNHGKEPWNKGTKGLVKANSGSIKKGEQRGLSTQFKIGSMPWSKLHPDYMKGEKHWNWSGGHPKCVDCGKKLASYNAKYCLNHVHRGERSSTWKGGRKSLKKLIRELSVYKEWRLKIFTRDNFSCQLCGSIKSNDLNADHYPISFSEILDKFKISSLMESENCELLWNINNGRTLCIKCHMETPNYLRR